MSKLDHTQALADYLPNGKTFEAKSYEDSNLRQLLRGLACEFKRAQDLIALYEDELPPDTGTIYVEEWERALGIPDDCFLTNVDVATRMNHVLIKLACMGVQTVEDFEDLALKLGFTVTVTPAVEHALLPALLPMVLIPQGARHAIIVSGPNITDDTIPFQIPYSFYTPERVLRCVFESQIQANNYVVFRST